MDVARRDSDANAVRRTRALHELGWVELDDLPEWDLLAFCERMHGVWREGSLGIGVGTPSKSLSYEFASDAWARYDAYAKQAVEKNKMSHNG